MRRAAERALLFFLSLLIIVHHVQVHPRKRRDDSTPFVAIGSFAKNGEDIATTQHALTAPEARHPIAEFKELGQPARLVTRHSACPTSCELRVRSVMQCDDTDLLNALTIASCVQQSNHLLIADLRSPEPLCKCAWLEYIRRITQSKVLTFTSESCGAYLLKYCEKRLPEDVQEMNNRAVVAGLVMDQEDPMWEQVMQAHLRQLLNVVNNLEPGSKQYYRKLILKSAKPELLMTEEAERLSNDHILPFMKYSNGITTPLFKETDWDHVPKIQKVDLNSLEDDVWQSMASGSSATHPVHVPAVIEVVRESDKQKSDRENQSDIVPKPGAPTIEILVSDSQELQNISTKHHRSPSESTSSKIATIVGATFLGIATTIGFFLIWICKKSRDQRRFPTTEYRPGQIRDQFIRKLSREAQRQAYLRANPDKRLQEETERLLQDATAPGVPSEVSLGIPGKMVTSRVQSDNTDQCAMHEMWLGQNGRRGSADRPASKPRTMAEIQEQVRRGLYDGSSERRMNPGQRGDLPSRSSKTVISRKECSPSYTGSGWPTERDVLAETSKAGQQNRSKSETNKSLSFASSDPWVVDRATAWVEYSTRPESAAAHPLVIGEPDIPKTQVILQEQEQLKAETASKSLTGHETDNTGDTQDKTAKRKGTDENQSAFETEDTNLSSYETDDEYQRSAYETYGLRKSAYESEDNSNQSSHATESEDLCVSEDGSQSASRTEDESQSAYNTDNESQSPYRTESLPVTSGVSTSVTSVTSAESTPPQHGASRLSMKHSRGRKEKAFLRPVSEPAARRKSNFSVTSLRTSRGKYKKVMDSKSLSTSRLPDDNKQKQPPAYSVDRAYQQEISASFRKDAKFNRTEVHQDPDDSSRHKLNSLYAEEKPKRTPKVRRKTAHSSVNTQGSEQPDRSVISGIPDQGRPRNTDTPGLLDNGFHEKQKTEKPVPMPRRKFASNPQRLAAENLANADGRRKMKAVSLKESLSAAEMKSSENIINKNLSAVGRPLDAKCLVPKGRTTPVFEKPGQKVEEEEDTREDTSRQDGSQADVHHQMRLGEVFETEDRAGGAREKDISCDSPALLSSMLDLGLKVRKVHADNGERRKRLLHKPPQEEKEKAADDTETNACQHIPIPGQTVGKDHLQTLDITLTGSVPLQHHLDAAASTARSGRKADPSKYWSSLSLSLDSQRPPRNIHRQSSLSDQTRTPSSYSTRSNLVKTSNASSAYTYTISERGQKNISDTLDVCEHVAQESAGNTLSGSSYDCMEKIDSRVLTIHLALGPSMSTPDHAGTRPDAASLLEINTSEAADTGNRSHSHRYCRKTAGKGLGKWNLQLSSARSSQSLPSTASSGEEKKTTLSRQTTYQHQNDRSNLRPDSQRHFASGRGQVAVSSHKDYGVAAALATKNRVQKKAKDDIPPASHHTFRNQDDDMFGDSVKWEPEKNPSPRMAQPHIKQFHSRVTSGVTSPLPSTQRLSLQYSQKTAVSGTKYQHSPVVSPSELRMALDELDTDLLPIGCQSYGSIVDEVASELEFQMAHNSQLPSSPDTICMEIGSSPDSFFSDVQNTHQPACSASKQLLQDSSYRYLDPLSSLPCTAVVLPSTSTE